MRADDGALEMFFLNSPSIICFIIAQQHNPLVHCNDYQRSIPSILIFRERRKKKFILRNCWSSTTITLDCADYNSQFRFEVHGRHSISIINNFEILMPCLHLLIKLLYLSIHEINLKTLLNCLIEKMKE